MGLYAIFFAVAGPSAFHTLPAACRFARFRYSPPNKTPAVTYVAVICCDAAAALPPSQKRTTTAEIPLMLRIAIKYINQYNFRNVDNHVPINSAKFILKRVV